MLWLHWRGTHRLETGRNISIFSYFYSFVAFDWQSDRFTIQTKTLMSRLSQQRLNFPQIPLRMFFPSFLRKTVSTFSSRLLSLHLAHTPSFRVHSSIHLIHSLSFSSLSIPHSLLDSYLILSRENNEFKLKYQIYNRRREENFQAPLLDASKAPWTHVRTHILLHSFLDCLFRSTNELFDCLKRLYQNRTAFAPYLNGQRIHIANKYSSSAIPTSSFTTFADFQIWI